MVPTTVPRLVTVENTCKYGDKCHIGQGGSISRSNINSKQTTVKHLQNSTFDSNILILIPQNLHNTLSIFLLKPFSLEPNVSLATSYIKEDSIQCYLLLFLTQ